MMYKNLLLLLFFAFSGALQAQDCLPIYLGIESYIEEEGGPTFVEWQLNQNGEFVEGGIAQFSINDVWYGETLCLPPGCYDLAIESDEFIDPNALFAIVEPLDGWFSELDYNYEAGNLYITFCFEFTAPCELDVVYTPLDCGNHLFDIVSVDADWWGYFVNGELVAENVLAYEFDAEAPGIYEVTVMYETPECPNGVFWSTTIEVTEDCFNGISCEAELFITETDCGDYTVVFGALNSMYQLQWYVNDELQDIPSNQFAIELDGLEGPNVVCVYALDPMNGCEIEVCEDFFVEPCEVECEIGVWVDSIDCNTYVFGAETNMDNPVIDWFVNGEYVNQGNIYTFYTEVPGDYQICALYETPECPMGVEWCETFVITEDCFYDCNVFLQAEQVECGAWHVFADAPEDAYLYWYLDGELYIDGPVGTQIAVGEEGAHEVCVVFTSEECGTQEGCITLNAEGCEEACTEILGGLVSLIEEGGPNYVQWTLYDEFENEMEGSIAQFSVDNPKVDLNFCLEEGCYILEIFDPNNSMDQESFSASLGSELGVADISITVSESNYIVFEFCVEPTLVWPENDCPEEVLYAGGECLEYEFEIGGFQEGEVAIWSFGDGTVVTGGHYITHDYEMPGTYEVCVEFWSDDCPGIYVCDVIVVEDCEANPCEAEAVVSQVGCEIAYYNLISELPEGVFANVYLNEEFLWEGNSGSFSVEPGLNYLCVEYEHPDCEEVVTWCEDFYIEECLCPEYIDVWVEDCLVMASIPQSDGTGWVDWFFNGEYYQGGDVITFEAPANGEYELCAFYYSEICQGVDLCTIVGVDGCEEEGDCYMEGYLTEVECGQWQLDLFGDLPWEVSPQIYLDDELIGEGLIALFDVEEGWHYICASYYHEDCDGEVEWCYEFYVPGCDNDCFIAMEYDEVDALTYLFEVDAPDNATVYWTINDLDAGIGFDQTYTFLPGEQYEVCAFYETPECPWGMMACANIYTAPEMECTPVIFYLEMLEDFDVDVDIEYVIEGLGLELEGLITIQEECGSTFLEICVPDGCYEMTMGLEDLGEYALFLSILVDDLPGVNYQVDLLEQTVTMEFGVNQDCDVDTNVEEEIENALLIYPNPNTGQFYVEHNYNAEDQWEIVDLSGRLVQQGQFTQPRLSINVNDLSAGSYLFRVMGNKSQTVERIQIIR